MRLSTLAGAILACSLAACATLGGGGLSPAQSVFALEGTMTTAIEVATVYASLPSCGHGVAGLCSDPATVAKIKTAAPVAEVAMLSAEAVVTKGPAAQDALTAAEQAEQLVAAGDGSPEVKAAALASLATARVVVARGSASAGDQASALAAARTAVVALSALTATVKPPN